MPNPTTPGPVIHTADNPREISIVRYVKFCQACLRETGLCTDLTGLSSQLRQLGAFVNANSPAAGTAYTNLLQGIGVMERGEPLLALVLAAVTLSIGDKPCEDLSEAGLLATAHRILDTGIMQADLEAAVVAVKKNLQAELAVAFPARFSTVTRDVYAARDHELLLLEFAAAVSNEASYAQPIAELNQVLLQMLAPQALHPRHPANALLQLERRFQDCYAELETHAGVTDAKKLTAYEFFHRLEHLDKHIKEG